MPQARCCRASPIRRSRASRTCSRSTTIARCAMHKPEDFYDASFVTELDNSGYIDSLYK